MVGLAGYLAAVLSSPLSAGAAHLLFQAHVFADLVLSLCQNERTLHLEALHSTLMLLALCQLGGWCNCPTSQPPPHPGYPDARRLFDCVGLSSFLHKLHFRWRRTPPPEAPPASQPLSAEPSTADVAAAEGSATARLAVPHVSASGDQAAGRASALEAASKLPHAGSSTRSASASSPSPGGPASGTDAAERLVSGAPAAAHSARTVCVAGSRVAGAVVAESAETSASGTTKPAAEDSAAAAAPLAQYKSMAQLPPYKSFVRRRVICVKIPFAEPEQITPGYEQRLRELGLSRGLHITNVYVRSGCIELVLDVEQHRDHPTSRDPPPNRLWLPAVAACWNGAVATAVDSPEAVSPERASLAGGLSTSPSSTTLNAVSSCQGLMQDLEEIVAALGLVQPPSPAADAPGVAPQPATAPSAAASVMVADTRIGLWRGELPPPPLPAAEGPMQAEAMTPPNPQIVHLWPRVLLLTPPTSAPPCGGQLQGGSNNPAAAPPPLVELTATLSYHYIGGAGGCGGGVVQQPEVLVRGYGSYWPVQVEWLEAEGGTGGAADRSGEEAAHGSLPGDAGADSRPTVCRVRLLELPSQPGTLMVEFRQHGALLGCSAPLLLLSDANMATELQTALSATCPWPDCGGSKVADTLSGSSDTGCGGGGDGGCSSGGGGGSCCSVDGGMPIIDQVLLDLGTLCRYMAQLRPATAAAGSSCPPLPPSSSASSLPITAVSELADHLLGYATASGLEATARHLQADAGLLAAAAAAAAGAGSGPGAVAAEERGAGCAAASAAVTEDAPRDTACGGGGDDGSAGASGRGGGGAVGVVVQAGGGQRVLQSHLLQSLSLALGLSRLPPAEEAAYQAYVAPLVFAQGHVIQAVEVMSLVALLFRARHQLLDPGNLTSLAGCFVGTVTTLAWPLMPHRSWVALVNGAKIPRYLAYMTAKLMIGRLGFPAPPGIVPYQLGPAVLVMEGLLLPGSCLLSVPTALTMALLKWPCSVAMMLASGAATDALRATIVTARVVLMAVATTAACHTYLRYKYARRVAALAAMEPSFRKGRSAKAD